MAKKKSSRSVKSARARSWSDIGADIGKKVETADWESWKEGCECGCSSGCSCSCGGMWYQRWYGWHNGGGLGRLIFIIGALFALKYMGLVSALPWWIVALIVLGFWWMKF